MGRYIPQYLFDGLVVSCLAADLSGVRTDFERQIDDFLQKYPDENGSALLADLAAAADEGRAVVKDLLKRPRAPYADEAAVIEGLVDALEKAADRGKPLWRRMVESYFTNVQPTPILDRVEKARLHLRAAGQVLVSRMTPAESADARVTNAGR
jgi:hypothetical protein